ncbi:proteasome 26S subunit [Neoconidiobolus thromboides FSU 785]|nr:proteasome 26S subunit [Neoconidiobolus thromboides FSU 785]
MANLAQLHEQLKREYENKDPNALTTLSAIKLELIKNSFLTPASTLNYEQKVAVRDVLEIGALININENDIQGFERLYSQLQTYYIDHRDSLPPSPRENKLKGLYLMSLLAQNQISTFHLTLEGIPSDLLENNEYLMHPVNLEKALMEGSYNKVLNARETVPSNEFIYFMDFLALTIRDEIASCCEKAYKSLPIQQVSSMLFFKKNEEVVKLAKQRGWVINIDQRVQFKTAQQSDDTSAVPVNQVLEQAIFYAKEMERIV